MFLKRFFDKLSISILMMFLLYAGIQVAISQDSTETWKDISTGLI